MTTKPVSACSVPGCPNLSVSHGRCDAHARFYEQQRGTAAQRGYGSVWQKQRKAYLALHPFCVWCGASATVVDHKLSRRAGGADHPDNWQPMCQHCHNVKRAQESRA